MAQSFGIDLGTGFKLPSAGNVRGPGSTHTSADPGSAKAGGSTNNTMSSIEGRGSAGGPAEGHHGSS